MNKKFYELDIINIEIQMLGAKQKQNGLDALDIALIEKLVKTKIDILEKVKPKNQLEADRLEYEKSEMLIQTLVDIALEKPIEIEYKSVIPEGELNVSNKRAGGRAKKTNTNSSES